MDSHLLIEVNLRDYPKIEDKHRIDAEQRFARTLERCFPSPSALLQARKAFIDASEGYQKPKADIAKLATSWQEAFLKAHEAGLRPLGPVEEAYFDVRIAS